MDVMPILRQLSGRKILIKGNHDHWIDDGTSKYFESIHDYLKIIIDKKHVVLFHYPIAEWDRAHHGGYHLYGHVHGNLQLEGRAMDVGIDTRPTGDMKPWSWEEIDEILSKKEIIKHHGKTKPEAEYDAV
jgi:calcineurin-like phosphoesterase family protein